MIGKNKIEQKSFINKYQIFYVSKSESNFIGLSHFWSFDPIFFLYLFSAFKFGGFSLFSFLCLACEVLRSHRCHHRLIWLKKIFVLFRVEGDSLSELFIDNVIKTFPFFFFNLNLALNPFHKFMVFRIDGGVDSKLEFLFAFPKIWWFKSFADSFPGMDVFLVFIVIIFFVLFESCGIPVFVQQKSVEMVILEHELAMGRTRVRDGQAANSESMN